MVFVVAGVAAPAYGDTKGDLDRARRQLASAQAAADAAAARYQDALSEHAQLERDLDRTQSRIEAASTREAALKETVQDIAVRAYIGAGEPVAGTLLFGGDEVLDFGRTSRLLDRANAPSLTAIDDLKATRDDLERDREHYAVAKDRSDELVAQLDKESRRVQDQLAIADRTRQELETKYAAEQEQARLTAQRAAEEAARAAATSTTKPPANGSSATRPPSTSSKPSTPTTKPSTPTTKPTSPPPTDGGGRVCPVRGAVSFVDSWGAPRSGGRHHEGVDMMAVRGTPNVAIVAGTITQKSGTLSGYGVYLHGDDGNSYWYFHLDHYEGGPRRVAQGEVIGYTGNTGNADGGATHTHFEYHPGGGAAVNPYPIVRPIC
jgi:peptidoglycan LD-endopeptidase LytH